jgi:hypothetical protein
VKLRVPATRGSTSDAADHTDRLWRIHVLDDPEQAGTLDRPVDGRSDLSANLSRRADPPPVTRFPRHPARVRTDNDSNPAARPYPGWRSTRRSGRVGAPAGASTTTHSHPAIPPSRHPAIPPSRHPAIPPSRHPAIQASHPHPGPRPTSRAASQQTGTSNHTPATHQSPKQLKTP